MTKQQKTKRLSSPQGLGAPPVNPEGEDSLTNWSRFMYILYKCVETNVHMVLGATEQT